MTNFSTQTMALSAAARPRDVQVGDIGDRTKVLRARTWERLKFEVEYGRRKGTTANTYLISGEKTAIVDPPGESFTAIFLDALQQHIDIRQLDYVIVQHVNANRMVTLEALRQLAPQARLVCSYPAAKMLQNASTAWENAIDAVRSGHQLDLGKGHCLKFITVPTPRWPDGLCTYDPATRILYSDKFFGAHICSESLWDEDWRQLNDERQYYFDCLHALQVKQVEKALNRLEPLSMRCMAPGHGPITRYSLSRLRQDYRQWCQQQVQRTLKVALLYTSAYGSTAKVANAITQGLIAANVAVESVNCELTSPDVIVRTVQACDGFIIGSPTLGGHAPVQIQTALGSILANIPTTKLAGVFGSFGWSGEAIDLLEQKLEDAGFSFGFEPIRVRFSPNPDTLELCQTAGMQFARRLHKQSKQSTS